MTKSLNVCVGGCGSAGAAVAADIALDGHDVTIFELPEFSENLEPVKENGGIKLTGNTNSGKTGLATFENVTDDPNEAVTGMDVIMVTAPAFGHEPFTKHIVPYLEDGQVLVFNTGYWGSLRVRKILEDEGKLGSVIPAEAHIHPYLSRKTDPTHAHIYATKQDIRFAAWPGVKTDQAYEKVKQVYSQMEPASNVLETNFFAGNPSWHAPINIPRLAFFFDRAREFRFYGEVSPSASKLIDAFDEERMEVAAEFNSQVPTLIDWLPDTYDLEGESAYDAYMGSEHAKRWGTEAGNRRVLKEDLCYFYYPMEQLAEIVELDVSVTSAMIEVLQVITGYDYRKNGVTLEDLGMGDLDSKDQILSYVNEG